MTAAVLCASSSACARPRPALLTKAYNVTPMAFTAAAAAATELSDATSMVTTSIFASGNFATMSALAFSPFSGDRAPRSTRQACSVARSLQSAAPMPLFPPVTRMVLDMADMKCWRFASPSSAFLVGFVLGEVASDRVEPTDQRSGRKSSSYWVL